MIRAVSSNGHGGSSSYGDGVNSAAVGSGSTERDRQMQFLAEERKRREMEEGNENDGNYPEWATNVEDSARDDEELQEIMGDALEDPEAMKRRVENRVQRKSRDILESKKGSVNPMAVSFRDFDALDSHIWLEFYTRPTDKDVELIGSIFRSWFVLGRLGGFNAMNMQLTSSAPNAPLSYSQEKAKEAQEIGDTFFHNIGDVEFQDNWARLWVDLGTSDPVSLDMLINTLANLSSDHVGIKQLVFGGKNLGDWDEDLITEEAGYRSYKI